MGSRIVPSLVRRFSTATASATASASLGLMFRSPLLTLAPTGFIHTRSFCDNPNHPKAEPAGEDRPGPVVIIRDEDVESEASLWKLYERWMKAFHVSHDPCEKQERFHNFKEFAAKVYMNPACQLTKFADMTDDEFKRKYCGVIMSEERYDFLNRRRTGPSMEAL